MNKDTFYTLFDLPAHATSAEIDVAYQRQRDRYSAERVAALGDEFRVIAGDVFGERVKGRKRNQHLGGSAGNG